ncbi:hypothetical protein LK03_13265 [Pseudomonas cremoricolorata]|uniref:Uncharacterized protein n=1 Tax=Pseudomonas cremoricolorata TaxID=157783 RepID=A0A089WSR6_9PSED|nr:hypothetical protein LK03_13265 [Pseudomonas cremoricolorata]
MSNQEELFEELRRTMAEEASAHEETERLRDELSKAQQHHAEAVQNRWRALTAIERAAMPGQTG